MYVMDTGNKRVQAFGADGTFVAQYGGGGVVDGKFDEPVGLAQDAGGDWYVTDTWNHRVQKFDAGWRYLAPVGGERLGERERGQQAVRGGGRRSAGWCTRPTRRATGCWCSGWTGASRARGARIGKEANAFTLPTGIAVGPDGQVYVADGGANRIMIFPALAITVTARACSEQ